MNELTEKQEMGWRTIRLINFSLLIVSPIVYLFIVWLIYTGPSFEIYQLNNKIINYIFFGLAIVLPMFIPLIIKMFSAIDENNDMREPDIKSIGKFQTISIIKGAIVESIYIFGLVIFFLNHTVDHIWYFYAIGIFWTFIHFPRKSQYVEFIQKEQTNVITN